MPVVQLYLFVRGSVIIIQPSRHKNTFGFDSNVWFSFAGNICALNTDITDVFYVTIH